MDSNKLFMPSGVLESLKITYRIQSYSKKDGRFLGHKSAWKTKHLLGKMVEKCIHGRNPIKKTTDI